MTVVLTSSLFFPLVTSHDVTADDVCCPVRMHQNAVHTYCKGLNIFQFQARENSDVRINKMKEEVCVRKKRHTTDDVTSLSGFEELQASVTIGLLDLSSNALRTLPELTHDKFTDLQHLNLSRNHVTEADDTQRHQLTSLKSLTSLDLSYNELSALPPELQGSAVNTRDLSPLAQLTFLDLSHNSIAVLPRHALRGMTHMLTLNLSHNSLTEVTSDSLSYMTSLEYLDLSSNQLSSLPFHLFDDNAKLKVLDLSRNELTSLPVKILYGLKELQELYLQDNLLHDLAETVLGSATSVRKLDLSHNKLGNLSGSVFQSMNRVQHLDLSFNQLKVRSGLKKHR
jgi:Leucine-rich repeat (LRR) protein